MTYALNIEKPTFVEAIKKLEKVNQNIYNKLSTVIEDPLFNKSKKIRNDITHNYLPHNISSGINLVSENKLTFGIGDYIPSKEIKENATNSLDLFCNTIKYFVENVDES